MVVIADPGDALFASSELVIHRQTEFISPAYYTSMGFAVPAALGAMVARPNLRPVVLVGDGAFQMTGMELSTIVRHGFSPIVIVLDNEGYGTERLLHAGRPQVQRHPALALLTSCRRFSAAAAATRSAPRASSTQALRSALADTAQMSLLHVHLDVQRLQPDARNG